MTSTAAPEPGHGLRLIEITKRFGSLVANDAISLDIVPSEIHCLLGENGAGKSTLMNVLYGLLQPDGGSIEVDGVPLVSRNPKQAMAAGIGMVHQHFMLVDVFTVAENLILGRERSALLDLKRARRLVRELSGRYGLDVDPDAKVEDLPVGIQQRVEILKALANDARFLIFDEPTAVLTPQETDELITVMRSLRDEGKAIVFITHKLREVRAIADKITVIRRGKVVGQADPSESEAKLAELMVGRAVSLQVAKEEPEVGPERLVIDGATVVAPNGTVVVDDLSLAARGGEILCIAGVQGNGQSELAEALIGVAPLAGGTVILDGKPIQQLSPRRRIDAGLGYVPEDRQHDGFVGTFSVAENLVLNSFDEPPYAKGLSLNLKRIDQNAAERVGEFDIRTQSIKESVASLSGGNQQKLVLARELSRPLSVLIASQPTRGVDVGAIEFLHQRLVAERDRGTAVIIVSSELDEVAALADRIAVMYRGRIVGIVEPDTSREVLGLMMAGVPADEAMASASVISASEEDAILDAQLADQAGPDGEDQR
ncbi:ABC transporter ATP-binding protein [Microlunatus parietis]|uniref:Simple sugar transport system ATP-binding protein n=1 Tax=Microlunatus parietis TaxID=682979 RepID=A0A7Y9LDB5_9ACTN|nr:ABC transporter ATP-binding protein [Microlunatus parietis]NYE73727.1 simple sugar transport system ATP-binding protein [Microlunatus parietis]